MSEIPYLMDLGNMVLFALLILSSILFGQKNLKHLNELFRQTGDKNIIELRPIPMFNYNTTYYEGHSGLKVISPDILNYNKKGGIPFWHVRMIFDMTNIGKMVAQNITCVFKIIDIDHDIIPVIKAYIDLSPGEEQRFTALFQLNELKEFIITFWFTWEYGQGRKGLVTQTMKVTQSALNVDYSEKKINLDWDGKNPPINPLGLDEFL